MADDYHIKPIPGNVVTIHNWAIETAYEWDKYSPPELMPKVIVGSVYGHHRKADGLFVKTSWIESEENGLIVTHSGTRYKLGRINRKYSKMYPEARKVLIKSLRERAKKDGD